LNIVSEAVSPKNLFIKICQYTKSNVHIISSVDGRYMRTVVTYQPAVDPTENDQFRLDDDTGYCIMMLKNNEDEKCFCELTFSEQPVSTTIRAQKRQMKINGRRDPCTCNAAGLDCLSIDYCSCRQNYKKCLKSCHTSEKHGECCNQAKKKTSQGMISQQNVTTQFYNTMLQHNFTL
jgi:hypothetical protein